MSDGTLQCLGEIVEPDTAWLCTDILKVERSCSVWMLEYVVTSADPIEPITKSLRQFTKIVKANALSICSKAVASAVLSGEGTRCGYALDECAEDSALYSARRFEVEDLVERSLQSLQRGDAVVFLKLGGFGGDLGGVERIAAPFAGCWIHGFRSSRS